MSSKKKPTPKLPAVTSRESRRANLYKVIAKTLMSEDVSISSTQMIVLFSEIVSNYKKAIQSDNRPAFFTRLSKENETERGIIITQLYLCDEHLVGCVNLVENNFSDLINELNIKRLESSPLVPSSSENKLSKYTFFAFSPFAMKLAIIENNSFPRSLPFVLRALLTNLLGSAPYDLIIERYSTESLKERLKAINGPIVTATIDVPDKYEALARPPMRDFMKKAQNGYTVRAKFTARFLGNLSNIDVEELINLSTEGYYYNFKVKSADTEERDALINLLDKTISEHRPLALSRHKRLDDHQEAYTALILLLRSL